MESAGSGGFLSEMTHLGFWRRLSSWVKLLRVIFVVSLAAAQAGK